jgi:hypothetical protein
MTRKTSLSISLRFGEAGRAHLYIDPNAGGLLWQLVAPLATLIFGMLLYLRRLVIEGIRNIASRLSWASACFVSVVVVIAVAAVNGLLIALSIKATFIVFMVAVVASTSVAGLGAGMVTTALSALTIAYFFLTPRFSLVIARPGDRQRLALFVLCGVISALLVRNARLPHDQLRVGLAGSSRS